MSISRVCLPAISAVGILLAAVLLTAFATTANAECFGEGEYQVCSNTYQDANGDVRITSTDSEGNSYSVGTSSRALPGGGTEIYSSDSEGNSYSIRSWSDSTGTHSVDSMGNKCTITNSGQVIGCGM